MQQLDALKLMRGGWKIGTRGRALWLWIACVVSVRRWTQRMDDILGQPPEIQRLARLTDADLFDDASAMALRAEPGAQWAPRSEARASLRQALKDGGLGTRRTGGKHPSHQTVADWLHVRPEESEQLRERGFGNPLPPAREFAPVLPSDPPRRADKAIARRAAIREFEVERAATGAPWATLVGIAERLHGHGLRASLRTIRKDLAALGIENPNGHEVRRIERSKREAVGTLPFGAA